MGRLGWRILVAFLAVTFVPMAVMGSAAWVQARGVIEEYLAQDTEQKVRLWATDLDAFLAQQRSILDALPLGNDSSETEGMLDKAVAQTPPLEALLLMDFDGSLIASSPRPDKIDPWVRQACTSLIADPTRVMTHGGDDHTHQVVIATAPEGTNGALCALVSFTLHQDMLAERARSVAGATPYIVDRNGDVVCHAYDEAEHHVGRGQFLGGLPATVAERGVIWSGRIRDKHGVRYAAYAPAKTLPWGIWVEIPDDVATASLQPMLRRAGLYALAFGGVVTIFAFVASRSLVRPLNRVAAAAQGMAGGRPGQTVLIEGADEVADLARQFNRMSLALADSYRELDDRVARRTRELAAARDFSDQLIDTMHERILVLSLERVVVRANNAARAAWGDDIVGLSWDALVPRLGADPDQVSCPTDAVLDEGRPRNADGSAPAHARTRPPLRTRSLMSRATPFPARTAPSAR
ncbi:MAG: HAMP domain-containing protein [Oligoflexia bacterium]|nr:HAMP domain-containing protein [Oligoflexia bacterium]